MSDATPLGGDKADTGGKDDSSKPPGGDPPPPPSPADPTGPVRPADPTAALTKIGEDFLKAYNKIKLADWIGVFAIGVATLAIFVSGYQAHVADRQYTVAEQQYQIAKDQYQVAVSTLKGNALIQLRQDKVILDKFIADNAKNINDISEKKCQERKHDIGYDDEYKMAKNELHEIVDFYDFYSMEKHEYNLISPPDWDEVCAGARNLAESNCFYKAEFANEVRARDNKYLVGDLSCGTAQAG